MSPMERRCKKRNPLASEEPRCVIHDLPDDLFRLILLRLNSPLWLVRAACVCKRWRRVIDGGDGGRAFLCLARSLHPPVVVGHYNNYVSGCHRFVPSSPMPIRLSLDFIPREFIEHHRTIKRWHVADCHGGLVLLREGCGWVVPDIVVCDPLSGRYRDIHHPPQASSHPPMSLLVFMLDGNDNDNISLSNFRVLYCSYSDDNDVSKVYSFSTADGEWRLVRQLSNKLWSGYISMGRVIGRIDRSLYLASPNGSVGVLDNANANARLVLSEVDLPTRVRKSAFDSTFVIVHGASTEPAASAATASIVHVRGKDLELFRQIPSSGKWVLEHSIPRLSEATRGLQGHPEPSRWRAVDIIAGGTRLAVLKVSLSRSVRGCRRSWLFSLDVDAMQLQVVPDVAAYDPSRAMDPKIIYTLPWPQFLTALAS